MTNSKARTGRSSKAVPLVTVAEVTTTPAWRYRSKDNQNRQEDGMADTE